MRKLIAALSMLSVVSFASAQGSWYKKNFTKDTKGLFVEFKGTKAVIYDGRGKYQFEGFLHYDGSLKAAADIKPEVQEGEILCYWFNASSWVAEGVTSNEEIKLTFVPNMEISASLRKACAESDKAFSYARDVVPGTYFAD